MKIPPRVTKAIDELAKIKKPGDRVYIIDIPSMTINWLVELGVVRAEMRPKEPMYINTKHYGDHIYFYTGGMHES